MEDCTQQKSINIPIEIQSGLSSVAEKFSEILDEFDPISLKEMDSVTLMNRVDTKFLLNINQLPELLRKAGSHYRIVEIDGVRISPYSSVYFDTDNVVMYTMHHNGKLNRYKIRMRTYVNSGLSFLEIKKKNNKGRTSKKRIRIEQETFRQMKFENAERDFTRNYLPYSPESLHPVLQNFFQRVTLVDKNKTERVTLDLGLSFRRIDDNSIRMVSDLAIVEMKQDGACKSFFRECLNELGVLPGSMSKYCLGMVLTNEKLKYNRFKNKLRKINKITINNHVTV